MAVELKPTALKPALRHAWMVALAAERGAVAELVLVVLVVLVMLEQVVVLT